MVKQFVKLEENINSILIIADKIWLYCPSCVWSNDSRACFLDDDAPVALVVVAPDEAQAGHVATQLLELALVKHVVVAVEHLARLVAALTCNEHYLNKGGVL